MCHVVYVFRTCERIEDIFFYTREKAKVVIDNDESSVQFLFNLHNVDSYGYDRRPSLDLQTHLQWHSDHPTGTIQNSRRSGPLLQSRSSSLSCSNIRGVRGRSYRTSTYSQNLARSMETEQSLFCVLPEFKCCLQMEAHLAASVAEVTRNSQTFRKRFWHFLGAKFGFYNCLGEYNQWALLQQEQRWSYMKVKCMVDIVCRWPKQKIDYAWGYRVELVIEKRVLAEEALNWLSTLGGGYASLGDYHQEFAEKAGQISWHQLKLAVDLGDPVVASKCRVFWAQSLLQRGHLRQSKIIIRAQYKFVKSQVVPDTKLLNMCLSLWNRLKHLYQQRRLQRLSCPPVSGSVTMGV